MAIGYAVQNADPETTARALGREIPVKPKFTVNVCRAIKGMSVARAKEYLEAVIRLEQAVPFTIHKRHVKHRVGMGPGAYPVNSARAVLAVLKDAESNAEYKGLDPENMMVWHTAAHRAAPIRGTMPRAQGRATAWDKSTSHIEVVLKERAERGEKAAAPAKPAAKKTPAKKGAVKAAPSKAKTTAAKKRVESGTARKSKKEE